MEDRKLNTGCFSTLIVLLVQSTNYYKSLGTYYNFVNHVIPEKDTIQAQIYITSKLHHNKS